MPTSRSPRHRTHLRLLALPVCLAVLAATAAAQGGAGVDREAMWPAPTAKDWARPCLIPWQRTWEDAQAVSRETGAPLLVCVNMDGEIASEHYAGVRYRQPEIAALYEPYVTVIASVYRHTPRDYDEAGRRILCPRFGSVTCGEHIAIEPRLYERYFEGKRIAPRHIGVELDGEETYDVYYAWDTASVFETIRTGASDRPGPLPVARGDRSLTERVASLDNADRTAVETAYAEGHRAVRRSLLEVVLAQGDGTPVDLLRLAVFGLDLELARLARQALARSSSPQAVGLIGEALRVPMDAAERDALIAALERLGSDSPRARTLAAVHRGLSGRSRVLDASAWSSALQGGATYPAAVDGMVVESRLEAQDEVLAADDAGAHLDLAESFLQFAYERSVPEPKFSRLLFMDARDTARKARQLGATGWRVDAALAIAAYYLGDVGKAYERAQAAVTAGVPSDATGFNAMAVVAIFAEARQQAIQAAVREKVRWPPQWLADVQDAYAVLARHPRGTDVQVAAHYDFLNWLGAFGRSRKALQDGLARFPDSADLHGRLRRHVLWERGVDGIEAVYARMLEAEDASPNLPWFAGRAAVTVAEIHRRAGRGEQALAAYDRAVAHFERDIEANPDSRGQADAQVALALAGRARLAYEGGDDDRAVAELLACLQRCPDAAAARDGLNLSPVDTSRMVLARLLKAKRPELVGALTAALEQLDPELLRLPAFERELPPYTPRRRQPARRRPARPIP